MTIVVVTPLVQLFSNSTTGSRPPYAFRMRLRPTPAIAGTADGGAGLAALVAVSCLGVVVGCGHTTSPTATTAQRSLQHRVDQGEALLNAAVTQLRDLPAYVQTDLRPPKVILDSTKSADHQDVMATVSVNPNVPEGFINYLSVPAGNGNFRTLGVQSGDRVKYFVNWDKESLEADIQQRVAMDLKVGQVVDNNSLLFEGGFECAGRA